MFSCELEIVGKFSEDKTGYNAEFLKEHKLYNNLGFPPSYIDFVIKFGWGRLCGLFLVYVPLLDSQYPDSWEVQYKKVKGWMDDFYGDKDESYDFLFEPDGTADLVKNAVPFAMSENGDYLIWDVENPDERGEYPIYLIAPRFSGIIYYGKDLAEFVNHVINRYFKNKEEEKGENIESDIVVAKTFEPFVFV